MTAREGLDRTLGEFAEGQDAYELRVPNFDETLWFAPNDASAAQIVRRGVSRGRIWTAEELRALWSGPSLSGHDHDRLVDIKAAFGAEIVSVEVDHATRGCRACSGDRFWISIHGVTVCGSCHPPATPDLVASWIEGDAR